MKKDFLRLCVSFSAPCLLLLGILCFLSRNNLERVQSLPAIFIGLGLMSYSAIGRNIRRKNLLQKILYLKNDIN